MNFKEYVENVLNEEWSITSAKRGDIVRYKGNFYIVDSISNRLVFASPVEYKNGEVKIIQGKNIRVDLNDNVFRNDYKIVARSNTYKIL